MKTQERVSSYEEWQRELEQMVEMLINVVFGKEKTEQV